MWPDDILAKLPRWSDGFHRSQPGVQKAREAVAHLKPIVVVTGGSRGIGFAMAARFLRAGNDVAVVARNGIALDEAVAQLEHDTGKKANPIICDVSEPNAPQFIASKLAEGGYYSDILVNNAGIGLAGAFTSNEEQAIERLLATNVAAITRMTRAYLPAMIERRRGGIINLASLGGITPGPHQAVHYASKAYIVSLTEAIASEVSGKGVGTCVVAPGPVNTGFHKDMGADKSLYRAIVPALSPERVAAGAYLGYMLGSRMIVPGLFNKLMFLCVRFLPRPITLPFVGALLKRTEG